MERLSFSLILVLLGITVQAQSGSCGASGLYINYNDYINYDRTVGGDVEIAPAGYVEIGANGVFENYGAIHNDGTIEIDSGGTLTLYGDMLNNGNLIVHKGAVFNFYGKNWTNASTAVVADGDPINTVPGGDVVFFASRPSIPSSWLVVSPCLSLYSGGDTAQVADGGNVPMDVNLRLANDNNVVLINNPLRIEGKLQWDVANSHLILGNNDLIMTTNASQDGYGSDRFVVTNADGRVVKQNYLGPWVFPVGIRVGDYTPALINNTIANTMHVRVQDYATSFSDEVLSGATADGMDRTWNIYADIALGNSNITLQHNTSSNQSLFNPSYNFITRWSNDTPNTTGDYVVPYSSSAWQTNVGAPSVAGNLSSLGLVAGSEMNSRTYSDFATTATAPQAFFSKSSDAFHPLPLLLKNFTAQSRDCSVKLDFELVNEAAVNKVQIQHSIDGHTFSTIASFLIRKDTSRFSFVHRNFFSGKNYYRLVLVKSTGDYTLSSILERQTNCDNQQKKYLIYPNPAVDIVSISGISGFTQIRVIDINGKVLMTFNSQKSLEMIDIARLPASVYFIQISSQTSGTHSFKLFKQ